ncbi:glycosyltransferase family 2 protein [Haloferax volcanii]|uniref:Glycosyltransferase n=1 Tax=Haloferax volcanii TaxID=2246 RepID=A0A847TSX1_HALVO|nr:glycosyltransferase family 2 protein [Haloferax alexandrinus]NLV03629.1 glycosyltransferase [Haloferax alexandrinus]
MSGEDTLVVLVNYKTQSEIKQLISGPLDDLPVDVVIVDNFTDSGLRTWAVENGVKYIDSGGNVGYSRGNNQGIEYGIGDYEYFFVLNPDTKIIDEDVFSELTKAIRENPETGIVSPSIIDQHGVRYTLPSKPEKALRKMGVLPELPKDSEHLKQVDHVPGSAMMISKDVIEEIGYLDESFFLYVEDTEYCYRARQAGIGVATHIDTEVLHYSSESGQKFEKDYQIYYRSRNRYLLARERFDIPGSLIYSAVITSLLVRDVVNIVSNSEFDLIKPLILGVFDGITNQSGRTRY